MYIDINVAFMVKGSEEQLQKLEALINQSEDNVEKFSNEVAQLAIANDSENWEPEDYQDYEYPGTFNGCSIKDGILELAIDSYIDIEDLLPDHVETLAYMLEAAFPDIEANWLYRADEAGEHGVFAKGGGSVDEFWPAYYIVECDEAEEWIETLDELIEVVEEWTDASDLETYEDCVEALENYCEENDINHLIVAEFILP